MTIVLKNGLIALLILFLAGCLNNPNGHPPAQPLTPLQLSSPHHYQIPPPYAFQSYQWWTQFHDPQLNQLIAIALVDSPNIRIAQARLEQAHQAVNAAESPLWPSINSSGYLRRERFSKYGLVPPPFNGKVFNIGDVAFNFNYELDFWGKNRNLLAAQINRACAQAADTAEAQLMISAAVATAYFQLQGNIAREQIAEKTLARRSSLFDIISRRAKHGIESQIPVSTQLSEVEQARIDVEQQKVNIALAQHQLAILIGKNPDNTSFDVTPFSSHPEFLTIPANLPAHLLAARPDVTAAKYLTEAAAHEINVAKARFFPDINLTGLFSYQSVRLGKLFKPESQDNAIQGAFDLPIFDAGLRYANLGIRYAQFDEAVNTYNQTLLNALKDVADQESILNSLSKQRAIQAIALQSISRSYRLTNARYQHGINDYVSVLQIEQLLLVQEDLQIRLRTQQLQRVVSLIQALGGNIHG